MIVLIIKKENPKKWTRYVRIKKFNHKWIGYYLYGTIKKIQGYEVEVFEDEI